MTNWNVKSHRWKNKTSIGRQYINLLITLSEQWLKLSCDSYAVLVSQSRSCTHHLECEGLEPGLRPLWGVELLWGLSWQHRLGEVSSEESWMQISSASPVSKSAFPVALQTEVNSLSPSNQSLTHQHQMNVDGRITCMLREFLAVVFVWGFCTRGLQVATCFWSTSMWFGDSCDSVKLLKWGAVRRPNGQLGGAVPLWTKSKSASSRKKCEQQNETDNYQKSYSVLNIFK